MTDRPHEELKRLFELALATPASERAPLLARECAGDVALRRRIEAMLRAADDEHFLSAPSTPIVVTRASDPSDELAAAAPLREGPGTRIGPYKLLQQIGEGGFGVVFMAEQEKPVARKVALKIIKLGMDTRQVVARFEQERQALAIMDHPNIARVIDAGATETGRPYFVMELVKGEPITDYCDAHTLTIDERLELFAQVCAAVQHAHTKGIIHRDIKPSNVLVATHDGRPHAKVIDFGIAKATSQKLTDKTLFTEHHQVIGTLQYMSPEQAEGSLDIDTRADVYALGVLLYELLTGSTPFDAKTLRDAMYGEIQRIIREVEPPRPSTRLHESVETLASIAASRRVEPKRLGSIVRGDLDWVVMKALAKERQRRYESANALAADIRRYSSGEPVTAAPPSAAYRFRKLVQRNKVRVAAGALVVLAILAGSSLAVLGFVQASRERDTAFEAEKRARAETARAVVAEERAIGEAERATSAEARAVDEARTATEIAEFLANMLRSVGPKVALGRDTTLMREIVDNTALRVEKELADKPLVASRLLRVISSVYNQLAIYDEAERTARRSVELVRSVPGKDQLEVARALYDLALVLESTGRFDAAKATFQECYEMHCAEGVGETDDALQALSGVGGVCARTDDYAAAEPTLRKVVDGQRTLAKGQDSQHLATALDRLAAVVNRGSKNHLEAETLEREALAMRQRLFGELHPDIAVSLSNLATTLADRKRYDEAIAFGEQAIEQHRRLYGERHPRTASAEIVQSAILERAARIADAIRLRQLALEILVEKLGAGHRETLDCNFRLGLLFDDVEDYAGAEGQYRAMLDWARANYAPGDTRTAAVLMLVANAVMHQHRYADAEALYREALEARRATRSPGHPQVIESENALADCLVAQGRRADAEPLLLGVEQDARIRGASSAEHKDALKRLVAFYTTWHAADPDPVRAAAAAEWAARSEASEK